MLLLNPWMTKRERLSFGYRNKKKSGYPVRASAFFYSVSAAQQKWEKTKVTRLPDYKSQSTAVPAASIDSRTLPPTSRKASPFGLAFLGAVGQSISEPSLPSGNARLSAEFVTHCLQMQSGAADGTRTRTVSLPGDFKSPVSTDSTTAAAGVYDTIFLFYRQDCFGEDGNHCFAEMTDRNFNVFCILSVDMLNQMCYNIPQECHLTEEKL